MKRAKRVALLKILHELVWLRKRIRFVQYADDHKFISISGIGLTFLRGKHRSLPGRGMSLPLFLRDDFHFDAFRTPEVILNSGIKRLSKEAAEALNTQFTIVNPFAHTMVAPEDLVP